MIVSEYNFKFYSTFETLKEQYPDLVKSSFVMSIQTDQSFYTAIVGAHLPLRTIWIEIYNENEELVQPRIIASSNSNLFFAEIGYYLVWLPLKNKFIFGKGVESEILQNLN